MARKMSTAALAAVGAQQTSEVLLFVLDISLTVDNTLEHYYFVNNTQQIIRNGVTYEPLAFRITLPAEGDEVTAATITIDAVDRQIIEVMRKAEDIPEVSFSLILASAPNAASEAGPFNFQLKKVSYNSMSLQAELSTGNHLDGAFPKVIKTPYYFPALF